jgi:hypothetical protein
MRAPTFALPILAVLLAAGAARAEDADAAPEPAAEPEALVIPDGYKARRRGAFTVYCRKETVMGTRIPAEKCYDENGLRTLVQELRETREKVDQMRRICGSQAACGSR